MAVDAKRKARPKKKSWSIGPFVLAGLMFWIAFTTDEPSTYPIVVGIVSTILGIYWASRQVGEEFGVRVSGRTDSPRFAMSRV